MPNLPQYALYPRILSAILAAALIGAAGSAAANTAFPQPADMARGVTMTPAQCAALPHAVWVRAMGRAFCIRYYISTVGGSGTWPVVFLQGDKRLRVDRNTRTVILPPNVQPFEPTNLTRLADRFSRAAGTTAIYLARPGIDGSSGNHIERHTVLELQVMNAALDAIRRRHGFEGFHLAGQSGGATLVGGLLGLRADIGCAVPGAGRLAQLRERRPPADPARRVFDVVDFIPQIVRNSRARILVVTDPQDVRVPLQHQATFVELLRRAGGNPEHYFVQALDENHHGTIAYTRPAVAACMRGASQNEISAELAAIVARRLAAKARTPARQHTNPQ